MLARHSSGSVNRVASRYNVLSGEHLPPEPREKSKISDESATRASQPDLADLKSSSAAARTVTDNPEIGFWPSVMGFILEGFALYAASLHSARLFPVESHPDEQIPPSNEILVRERRSFVSLVSATAGQGTTSGPEPETDHTRRAGSEVATMGNDSGDFDHATSLHTGRSFRWNWLTSCWETVVTFGMHRRKEREVNRTVAALMNLDDETLRDMGIPDRSQLKQIVRFCRDC
jgi:uncharacterized protein YjiS (DUF1127 family)